ncbi:hypothetical protein [Burkholderia pseudomallei]|uniref:hypothetical protein n=1 Tax=Burkholderia pseudomallei TaxID=28450 RepID=UPI000531503B|nr:hypothetical protein [Burkholderia pseudomallei]KGS60102.1 hypothetical protein X949_233 [Burkholderia pseudomallei MSHR5609]
MAKTYTQHHDQYFLFPHDEKTSLESDRDVSVVRHHVFRSTLAGSPFRFKPAPKDKVFAKKLVLEAMVGFQHRRYEWLPSLAHFDEPFCFDLPRETRCVFQLWTAAQDADFVGAHYRAVDELVIYLPHPQRWKKLSLDWLATPRYRCGSYNCDPAPFLRRSCPNAGCHVAKTNTRNLFQ